AGGKRRPHRPLRLLDAAQLEGVLGGDETLHDVVVELEGLGPAGLLGPPAVGDVARHGRRSDDAAPGVANRRDRESDVDAAAILTPPDRLVVLDRPARGDLGPDARHLVLAAV